MTGCWCSFPIKAGYASELPRLIMFELWVTSKSSHPSARYRNVHADRNPLIPCCWSTDTYDAFSQPLAIPIPCCQVKKFSSEYIWHEKYSFKKFLKSASGTNSDGRTSTRFFILHFGLSRFPQISTFIWSLLMLMNHTFESRTQPSGLHLHIIDTFVILTANQVS